MADGLIEILYPRLPSISNSNNKIDKNNDRLIMSASLEKHYTESNSIKNTSEIQSKYKWIKIHDMRNELGMWNAPFWSNISDLEIEGRKYNIKQERKWMRKLYGNAAIKIIQRNVRKWLAKIHIANNYNKIIT